MPIVRLYLLLLAIASVGCASSAASVPVGVSAELDECTELVRGLLSDNIGTSAREEICQQRAAAAEKRADKNEWLSRWGLPLGGIGGATIATVLTVLLFNFAGR